MNNLFCNQKLSSYAPLVLRLGLAAVVAWFGISQISDTESWADIVPAWAVSYSHLSALTIVHLNGWFEVVAAALLALGVGVRWVGLLLSLHLLVIASDFGLSSPTGVRDFGLAIALLSIFFAGQDQYCLDYKKIGSVENK